MYLSGDFHVHTNFCPHGSSDRMELYVQEAIEKKLTHLTFTEHAPLPVSFLDPAPARDSAMLWEDVEPYKTEALRLKNLYKEEIQIEAGFEVDYLVDFEEDTQKVLTKLQAKPEQSILSVHMLKAPNGEFVCLDYSADEFGRIIRLFGSLEEVYKEYFLTLKEAVISNLGPYKPSRIGHITLIDKFSALYNPSYDYSNDVLEILYLMKDRGYSLDTNTAGFFKEFCGICYPPPAILKEAQNLGIPLVPGSDSHSAGCIAQGFNLLPGELSYHSPK